ncbi:MAG: PD40 domain-containing protein, partial [Steroidobacter sp.]
MFTILKATAFRGCLLALLLLVGSAALADVPLAQRVLTLDRGVQDPAVSNDGKTVAVGLLGQIWLVPIEGGVARQLTSGSGWRSHPAWSPDGRFLAYAYQHRTGTDLVVRSLGDGTERTVHTTKFQIGQIEYHEARREIFFIEERSYLKAYLWSVPTAHYYEYDYVADLTLPHGGGVPKQWTFGSSMQADWSFAFSPDGNRVALEHVGDFAPSKRELIVLNLRDSQMQRLPDPAQDGDPSLAWTRDGQSLLYMDREDGMDHVTLRSVNTGETRRIFSSVYDGKQLVLHPDGKSAVMVAGRKLFRLQLDSGRRTPIAFTARLQLPARARTDLRIVNARLFDATGDAVAEHAGVDIEEGRIVRLWTGVAPVALKKG